MSGLFSSKQRTEVLKGLHKQKVDLLVIGGGITGSGIALDAVTRGMNTVVVEMQDFAAGTSSRSTKLVHGGLRYLKQLQVNVVAETGKERAIVYENGPHVTKPEWMMLPFHTGGTFGAFSTSIGLRVYDFLAGVKKKERRQMFNVQTTIDREPLVKREGLKGSGYYVEYRTDDARLTIEVMKEAVKRGATAINYAKVDSFIYENGKVVGVNVVDQLTGEEYAMYAKKIVNATGPWVDTLREKDNSKKGKVLQLSKGVHLVIDQSRFPLKQAIYFDTPDGRMVFAIPRDGKTYVGTTDTFYDADKANPRMTVEDREYIIDAINYMFPTVKVTVEDVESSWAGVRPLIYEEGKNASEISRKDEIWTSDSGLITIAGGKLTGYRHMAQMVVDLVATKFKEEEQVLFGSSQTKHMPISGGDVGGSTHFEAYVAKQVEEGAKVGLTTEEAEKLARFYGSNVSKVYALVSEHAEKAKEFGLPADIYATVVYAIEEEMTATPIDFFMRRTGTSLFNIKWVYKWKQAIVDCMSSLLEWTAEEKAAYMKALDKHLHECATPVDEKKEQSASKGA
ncbi:glycerol-3-phosphate dehydrogenase/oxidase [Priestia taiwanensis]|uniref:Glycerol-3-phosphate dehydrogenase n=1 Tax=Priestia taiwanensis TaxID=1347902 RepID=A0A917EQJ5_9BACI|nr:glycerol-3-phosphate dehydrogenase/oxidase [Priestia taiwanensis]MBM7364305.1 glycerol-3-phosphate dehydrogenase [Priestia taiwanensis]GGE73386.1 glycerol-3-phosphate dehydrogenase [Priestia taiwanensis]